MFAIPRFRYIEVLLEYFTITGVKNIVPHAEDVVYEEVPLYINLLFMSKKLAPMDMDMARVS